MRIARPRERECGVAYGTKRTCRDVRRESAFGGKEDIDQTSRKHSRACGTLRSGLHCAKISEAQSSQTGAYL